MTEHPARKPARNLRQPGGHPPPPPHPTPTHPPPTRTPRQRGGPAPRRGKPKRPHPADPRPVFRGEPPHTARDGVRSLGTQAGYERPRINEHRAGRLTHAVGGTCFDALVPVVLLKVRSTHGITGSACLLQLTPQNDPHPGRERDILRGTDRLAKAALKTPINFFLDRDTRLEVCGMGERVVVNDDAGVENSHRIKESFHLDHRLVQFIPVLPTNIGSHDPTGSMLGFEGASRIENKIYHLLGEGEVSFVSATLEPFVEHKVDVAILGVTEDDTVFVAVRVEELHETLAHRSERLD